MSRQRSWSRSGVWALAALLAFSGPGCASVTNAYVATPLDPDGLQLGREQTPSGLLISGEENAVYASELFGFVEVTFENMSNEWLQVEALTLDFGSPERNRAVYLPDAAELDAWYVATVQRNDIRDTNAATALDALLFVGTAAAVAGKATGDRKLAAVGGVGLLGSSAAQLASAEAERIQSAERVPSVPGAHLLSVPFSVPPGLFAKKWLLLNTRDRGVPCIRSVQLDYELKGREPERVSLTFRSRHARSEWQRAACG